MARGGKREGAGRPRGATTRKTREIADKAASKGITPLEYMLKVLRDPKSTRAEKAWAAEKAAPYLHPKLSTIEHSGKDGGPIKVQKIEVEIVDPAEATQG